MKKYLLIITFFFLVNSPILHACSCAGIPTFCETIADEDGNIIRDLIIRGTIIDQRSDGVEVQIDNFLLGTLTEETIFIQSGDGADCGVYTGIFSENESYVFAFYEISSNGIYRLSICSVDYLKIENETLMGAIAPGVESLPFEELPNLEGCGSGLNIFSINNSLSVFPIPTVSSITIKNNGIGKYLNPVQVEFIDVIGRKVRQYQKADGWLAEEEWIIDVNELAAGVYFLKIISGSQDIIFRVVKQ